MKCGLLGQKLSHSYSPQIHHALSDYEYLLYEREPQEVESLIRTGDWQGLNVTIPYKKTVIPFCDELTPLAREIGSVNTLLRRKDGSILGDNTDAYGFESLLTETGFDPSGKKAIVLGSGGASATVCACLRMQGADVITVSRTGITNYENVFQHDDASLIVNTTPVGMYPNNGKQALDLQSFQNLEAVLDVIYNPARTALLLQAEKLGIPCEGGLRMLVAQGVRASEIFLGRRHPVSALEQILHQLQIEMQNIILIGMPGSGKSTIAQLLSKKLNRTCVELDTEIEKVAGKPIPAIFSEQGEDGFRRLETQVIEEFGKRSGLILSTGGGCVTREENYPLLHQNGVIVRISRDLSKLTRDGRPLSQNADLYEMARIRDPFYFRFADISVSNEGEPWETVNAIMEALT